MANFADTSRRVTRGVRTRALAESQSAPEITWRINLCPMNIEARSAGGEGGTFALESKEDCEEDEHRCVNKRGNEGGARLPCLRSSYPPRERSWMRFLIADEVSFETAEDSSSRVQGMAASGS